MGAKLGVRREIWGVFISEFRCSISDFMRPKPKAYSAMIIHNITTLQTSAMDYRRNPTSGLPDQKLSD